MEKTTSISVFEKLDEEQIMRADKAVKQAMVYEVSIRGVKTQEITFIGLKHIMLEFSARGNPLEIIESICNLEKDDPTDKTTWNWRAKVRCKNQSTNHESEGLAECPYMENVKYDPFGQRKAHSKAERNAWRKQIPELQIKEFLKSVNREDIQQVDEPNNSPNLEVCHCDWNDMSNNKGKCGHCGKPLTVGQIQALEKRK